MGKHLKTLLTGEQKAKGGLPGADELRMVQFITDGLRILDRHQRPVVRYFPPHFPSSIPSCLKSSSNLDALKEKEGLNSYLNEFTPKMPAKTY